MAKIIFCEPLYDSYRIIEVVENGPKTWKDAFGSVYKKHECVLWTPEREYVLNELRSKSNSWLVQRDVLLKKIYK